MSQKSRRNKSRYQATLPTLSAPPVNKIEEKTPEEKSVIIPVLVKPIEAIVPPVPVNTASLAKKQRQFHAVRDILSHSKDLLARWDIPISRAERLIPAVRLIREGLESARTYAWGELEEEILAAAEWIPEVKLMQEVTRNSSPGVGVRITFAPAMAFVLITLRYQPEYASSFWTTVARNEGARDSPEQELSAYMASASIAEYGTIAYVRHVAHLWNKAYPDQETKRVGNGRTRPIQILGTPLDGKGIYNYEPGFGFRLTSKEAVVLPEGSIRAARKRQKEARAARSTPTPIAFGDALEAVTIPEETPQRRARKPRETSKKVTKDE